MQSTSAKLLSAFMALLFAASALLQLNDPDPIPWVALYLAAAAASLIALRWTDPRPSGAVGLAAALWLCTLVAGGLPDEPHPMKYGPQTGWLADEVVREGGGLLIVLGWMLALMMAAMRAERAVRSDPPPLD